MKAAVLYAKDDLRYEDYPTPQIKDGQVLVRVKATGICGSDIPRVLGDGAHYYPIVLGHEFSGVVEETAPCVTSVKVGDRVAGVPRIPCHTCYDCLRGDFGQCKNYSFVGSREQGSFADYVALPEKNVFKIDPAISFEDGALFEPCTVALHALFCADYRGGEDVAVLGGGTIGLFTAQWAKIFGAKRVFVFDIDNDRLALARKLGADITLNTMEPNFKEAVWDYTNGRGFGFTFDVAGVSATMKLAFEIADIKSHVCFISTPASEIAFPPELFETMHRKEFTLTGSWQSFDAPFPGKAWELAEHFCKDGRLKFDEGFIFKKLPMNRIKEGFDLYKTPGQVKGKILLINEEE